jgi:uncharacterized protein (DUF4415 family)
MNKRKPLIDDNGEVKELNLGDMKRFKPIRDAGLSDPLLHKLGVRGLQKSPTKERITIRLSREVVDYFRASGEGWQTRLNDAMLELIHKRKAG